MSSAPPVVEARIESYYRVGLPRPILADIHLRIDRGQHWTIVGANGSGKSSLLSVIAGDIWPSRGAVHVLGHEYGRVDKRELKRRIGVVSAAMYLRIPGHDLALEVVAGGLEGRVAHWGPLAPRALESARAALERVDALEIAKKPYGVLSQGERQRTMIARALVSRPDLLVLDEPCSGLDPVARERFLSDVGRLARSGDGPTLLIVTHHLEEVPPFVSHALLLRDGVSLAQGRTEDVLTSELLSAAFRATCTVTTSELGAERRYALSVAHTGGSI